MIYVFIWLVGCNILLTGWPSAPEWVIATVYAVEIIGWVGIAGYGLWRGQRHWGLLLLWGLVWAISSHTLPDNVELIRLLGYIGLYSLDCRIEYLRPVADWLLVPVLALPLVWRGNPNDVAMLIWCVLMVSNRRGWWAVWAGLIMVALHSEGALIALLVGIAVERWNYRAIAPAVIIMAIIGLWRGPLSSAGVRWDWWAYALDNLTWWGNGIPYQHNGTGYTHNLIVDVVYIAGLPGMVLLAWLGLRLWRERWLSNPQMWPGFIGGFLVYALVDYPHWSIPGAIIMMILGAEIKNGYSVGSRIWLHRMASVSYWRSVQRRAWLVAFAHRH